jgi:carbonic anhydrase
MPVIGTQQSPIQIDTADTLQAVFPANYFNIRYASGDLPGQFKSHNFEFEPASRQPVEYRGDTWLLHKIHIHAPSEHLLDSQVPANFECHLIHYAESDPKEKGAKLVVGVLFSEKDNATTPPSIKRLNEKMKDRAARGLSLRPSKADETPDPVEIDPNDFLPRGEARSEWFRYEGSLTTGTFSEDVSWFVIRHQIEVESKDIGELVAGAKEHARVTQALDRRFVLRSFAK